jgi:hypothetical protein
MKMPADWIVQDLMDLINLKQEESLQLDFKRAESLDSTERTKTEISKDVSAFANSAGGAIVYGIGKSVREPHVAEVFSPIDPTKCPKEWLEQVINSRVQPRIHGVRINPVELDSPHLGQYAYVVCIPQSETAHQASDHRYYKRYNFESVAMEDYEVRQTMGRASHPAYKIKMAISQVSDRDASRFFQLGCIIENVSELVGRDVSAVIFLPKHLIIQPHGYEVLFEGATYSRIPGTWIVSSRENRTAIDIHPVSPCQFFFQRELRFYPNIPSSQPLKVIVRVYDQFGLAQTARVLLAIPGLETISMQEIPSPGTARRPTFSPF